MSNLPRESLTVPDVPDDGHVVHAGLVAVRQLLEAHLGLAVDWVAALGLHSVLQVCGETTFHILQF